MSDSLFAIASSGMNVERQRMEIIAQNLANAGTTRTASGALYQPIRLVSGPQSARNASYAEVLQRAALPVGVQAYGVEAVSAPPHMVHDPAHPYADANGMVALPGLDHASEMVLMVQTQRTYESNLIMFNAARSMYMRALDMGGR